MNAFNRTAGEPAEWADFADAAARLLSANRDIISAADPEQGKAADELIARAARHSRIYSAVLHPAYGQAVGPHVQVRNVLNAVAWRLLAQRDVRPDAAHPDPHLDDDVFDRMLEVSPAIAYAVMAVQWEDPEPHPLREVAATHCETLAATLLSTLDPSEAEHLEWLLVLVHNDYIDPSEPLPMGWETLRL